MPWRLQVDSHKEAGGNESAGYPLKKHKGLVGQAGQTLATPKRSQEKQPWVPKACHGRGSPQKKSSLGAAVSPCMTLLPNGEACMNQMESGRFKGL